jgi:hypothetical protein
MPATVTTSQIATQYSRSSVTASSSISLLPWHVHTQLNSMAGSMQQCAHEQAVSCYACTYTEALHNEVYISLRQQFAQVCYSASNSSALAIASAHRHTQYTPPFSQRAYTYSCTCVCSSIMYCCSCSVCCVHVIVLCCCLWITAHTLAHAPFEPHRTLQGTPRKTAFVVRNASTATAYATHSISNPSRRPQTTLQVTTCTCLEHHTATLTAACALCACFAPLFTIAQSSCTAIPSQHNTPPCH